MGEPLLEDGAVECANHSGVVAEALCTVCGKPVCADCAVLLGSRGIVCDEPEHRLLLERWTIVFRTNSEFEADMIVKNLENEGVELRKFSSRSFKRTIGENARDFVNVFVPSSEHHHAEQSLRTLGLSNIASVIEEPK
jgi:hypothetical protein